MGSSTESNHPGDNTDPNISSPIVAVSLTSDTPIKLKPIPKEDTRPVSRWRYVAVVIPVIWLLFLFGSSVIWLVQGAYLGSIAFLFSIPLILILCACVYVGMLWVRRKVSVVPAVIAMAIALIGLPIYPQILSSVQRYQDTIKFNSYMQNMVADVDYDIYLPSGFKPDPISGGNDLTQDGPNGDQTFVDPNTGFPIDPGISNYGTVFMTEGEEGYIRVYDKREIREDFGMCSPPLYPRDTPGTTLATIMAGGCNKVLTTPGGRTVYALGHTNGNGLFTTDIGNSRIAFTTKNEPRFYSPNGLYLNGPPQPPESWHVPDDFVTYVDSFHKVPLSEIEFTDHDGGKHHYSH